MVLYQVSKILKKMENIQNKKILIMMKMKENKEKVVEKPLSLNKAEHSLMEVKDLNQKLISKLFRFTRLHQDPEELYRH